MKSFNVNTLKLRTFKTNINYNKLEKYIRYLIKLKKLVPLSIYKPIRQLMITPLYLAVFLLSNSKKEIIETEQRAEKKLVLNKKTIPF